MNVTEALISVWPQYASRILEGTKAVELRTCRLRICPGARLWIYTTVPRGRVDAVARVKSVVRDTPTAIWKMFATKIGLTEQEYFSLFGNRTELTALELECIRPLSSQVDLQVLRQVDAKFRPPQLIKYLSPDNPLLNVLREAISEAA